MIAQIRAELLKIRSTRTTIGLILGMIALILLFTLLTGLLSHPSGLASKEDQRQLLSLGSLAGVFSALAGRAACDQRVPLRHDPSDDPIQPGALTRPHRQGHRRRACRNRVRDPRRGDRLGDRLRNPRRAWHHDRPHQQRHPAAHTRRARRRGACGARSATGLGAIIHNQVGAVITLLAWGFVVDNLLFGLVPSVGRFMPTRASDALMGLKVQHLLSPGAGAIVLIAWAAALAAVGIALTARRDIN